MSMARIFAGCLRGDERIADRGRIPLRWTVLGNVQLLEAFPLLPPIPPFGPGIEEEAARLGWQALHDELVRHRPGGRCPHPPTILSACAGRSRFTASAARPSPS